MKVNKAILRLLLFLLISGLATFAFAIEVGGPADADQSDASKPIAFEEPKFMIKEDLAGKVADFVPSDILDTFCTGNTLQETTS